MRVFLARIESPDHGPPLSILYVFGVEGGVWDYTMAGAGASELHIVTRKARNHQVALLMQKSWCLIAKMLLKEAKVKELTEEKEGLMSQFFPGWAPTLVHRFYFF